MTPFEFNPGSVKDTQTMSFVPSQATSFNPFPSVGAQSGLPVGFSQMQHSGLNQLNLSLAQEHYYQQQWQQQMQQQATHEPYIQDHQQQRSNMGQQHHHHHVQGQTQALYSRQLQRAAINEYQQTKHQWEHPDSPLTYATTSLALTRRQTPKQLPECAIVESAPLAKNHRQLQQSITSGFVNTKQQFTQQSRRPAFSQSLTAATSLPSPQVTPTRLIPTPQPAKLVPVTSQRQTKVAASAHADTAYRNEIAERVHLERERRQTVERHVKRREELRKDTSSIYRNYDEVLEYFPLGRGERPNLYLASLLANQPLPAEPISDRGLAIEYAKRHWYNYWGLEDLEYVVDKAKKEIEGRMEEQKKTKRVAATACRRSTREPDDLLVAFLLRPDLGHEILDRRVEEWRMLGARIGPNTSAALEEYCKKAPRR